MTTQTAVRKLIDTFADWLKYIRELNEMYEMNRVLRDMEPVLRSLSAQAAMH